MSNSTTERNDVQGMIFAAGLGTRFKPWTDKHPKALAVIGGRSLLQRNVEFLQKAGIYDVVVNVHHFADQIIDAIERSNGWGSRITISDESEEVLETGGGLLKAAPLFYAENILIINADILTDVNINSMITYHQQENNLATLAVSDRSTSRYFLFDEKSQLVGWRNIQTGTERISQPGTPQIQKAFSGIHLVQHALLGKIQQRGKFSMVDVYLDLAQHHKISGYDHTGCKFIDVGKPEAVAVAEAMFGSDL